MIPKETELLERLRSKYTPITSFIPRGDLSTWNDINNTREFAGNFCLVAFLEIFRCLSRRSVLGDQGLSRCSVSNYVDL